MLSKANTSLSTLLVTLLLVSCGADTKGAGTKGPSQLDPFWSATAFSGARQVLDIRNNAAKDDNVVVTGRVREFVENRSVFTLTDVTLKACNDEDCENCPTPWDYCCIEPEVVASNTITIEIQDDNGRPLGEGFKGFKGLNHLQAVTVSGTVSKDDAGNVTVRASSLHWN
ncbi:MAG: hypothetical protein QF412_11510 [Planctomycetota bacterium]|nr:hypothetical protein [Planctomycetota bacterium]